MKFKPIIAFLLGIALLPFIATAQYSGDQGPLDLTAITSIENTDALLVGDASDASELLKQITWANFKTLISTYVEGLATYFNVSTDDTDAITEGATNLFFTNERAQDQAGGMFTGNTETLITATYQDADGTVDLVVDGNLSNYTNDAGFLTDITGQSIESLSDVASFTQSEGDVLLYTGGAWDAVATSSLGITGGSGIASLLEDTSPQLGGVLDTNGNNISFPSSLAILDPNNKQVLGFTYTASAVNYLRLDNGSTGIGPDITALGTDTNIDINVIPKGSGVLSVSGGGLDGEDIADDTIDDDSIDLADVTLLDFTNDAGFLTSITSQSLEDLSDVNSFTQSVGDVLVWDGAGWDAVATATIGLGGSGGGSVTSVDASVPTGWAISGNPITSAGTLAFAYDTGYAAVLTASTTNWNAFYDTPSSRITAGTGLSWSSNTLNLDNDFGADIGPTELTSTDFGDFTCNGTTCSLDSDTVATNEIDLSIAPTWTGQHTFTATTTFQAPVVFESGSVSTSTILSDFGNMQFGSSTAETFNIDFTTANQINFNSYSGATTWNFSGITLAPATITTATWNGAAIDISDYTNLVAGDALTLSGDTINFDGGAAPGGELGGTWASPTIDDSLAVSSWNLTTPTFTTNFTFDGVTVTGLSGADTTVITGTAGTSGNCVEWNADGDIVDAGAPCGTGSGGGGALSTTTEKIGAGAAATVSYLTDEFMLGGSSSTTAEFLFDYASSSLEIRGSGTTSVLSTGAEEAVRIGEADQNSDLAWTVGEAIEFDFGTAGDVIVRGLSSVAEWVTDLAVTISGTLTATGVVDFGGATSVELPSNGTVNANGEITTDDTSGQLRYYAGSAERVLSPEYSRTAGSIGSTSPDRALNTFDSATTTWSFGHTNGAVTVTSIYGDTDTGTCLIRVGDGTNWTAAVTADSDGQELTGLSNNTFTDREELLIEIGSCASTPNFVTPTLTLTTTAD